MSSPPILPPSTAITERIVDPHDPRLEPFRAVRERDLIGRDGQFVVETPRLIGRLLAPSSRFTAEAVFLSEAQARNKPELVAAAQAAGAPVWTASLDLMSQVAGFPIHRGALAVAKVGDAPDPARLIGKAGPRDRVLIVVGVSNHDNIGALFRNAAAFGVRAVLLDQGSSDPLYRKAVRVSTGAILSTPFVHGGDAHALLDVAEVAGFDLVALSPNGSDDVREIRSDRALAVVVGAEGPGLPDDVLARCMGARVAMAAGHDSVNVATAAALALHVLAAPAGSERRGG